MIKVRHQLNQTGYALSPNPRRQAHVFHLKLASRFQNVETVGGDQLPSAMANRGGSKATSPATYLTAPDPVSRIRVWVRSSRWSANWSATEFVSPAGLESKQRNTVSTSQPQMYKAVQCFQVTQRKCNSQQFAHTQTHRHTRYRFENSTLIDASGGRAAQQQPRRLLASDCTDAVKGRWWQLSWRSHFAVL